MGVKYVSSCAEYLSVLKSFFKYGLNYLYSFYYYYYYYYHHNFCCYYY
jgi:hypothetical protein